MIACGALLWAVMVSGQDPVPGSAEAEADAAIAAFKQAYSRASTEDEQVLAVRNLGATVHPKTLAILSPLMAEGRPISTRIAAAMVLADFGKVDGAPLVLIKAYQNADRRAASRPVRIRIIQSLGELKADEAAGLINAAILDRDPWIARAAAKAAGGLRTAFAIDPLIKRLYLLESKDGEKPTSGNGSGVPDPSSKKPGEVEGHHQTERQVLQGPIHEALHSITKQRQTCADTWAKWWAQNRKDYKVPP
jgi:hypothetical protein